jgi:hypothetical protein
MSNFRRRTRLLVRRVLLDCAAWCMRLEGRVRGADGAVYAPGFQPSSVPEVKLADVLHAELCDSTDGAECGRYARGSGPHWEYYQERAAAVYTRLEPVIGGASMLLAVSVILDELW